MVGDGISNELANASIAKTFLDEIILDDLFDELVHFHGDGNACPFLILAFFSCHG